MDFEYLISTPKFVYSQSDPDPEFILSFIFLTRSLMDNGFWINKSLLKVWFSTRKSSQYFSAAVMKHILTSGSIFLNCSYSSKPSIFGIAISSNKRSYLFGLKLFNANKGSLNVSISNPARFRDILISEVMSGSSSTNKIFLFLLFDDTRDMLTQIYSGSIVYYDCNNQRCIKAKKINPAIITIIYIYLHNNHY